MKVRVEIYSLLREKLGWKERIVEIPGRSEATLREVLERAGLVDVIAPEGRLIEGVILLINGRNARLEGGLDARVHDNDEVSVFPPGGGG